jgi:putative flippase GtrA
METTASAPPAAPDLLDRLAARLGVSSPFIKFLFVGGVAYFVNQAALLLLYDVLPVLPAKDRDFDFGLFTHPDVRLLLASAFAVECAVIFKFFALEHWTFRDRPRRGWVAYRFLQFNGSAILSPIIVVVTVNVLTPVFGISPYISTMVGTIAGFMVNWLFSTYLIWPHERAGETDAA